MTKKFAGKDAIKKEQARRGFLGNGLSRTAMIYKIATLGGIKLTVPQLNKIKDVNPRQLESVYNEVVRMGNQGNARFALSLILNK
jgi:hypothetical protein